jgi:predicted MPP superfamily phosphohydrolase
MRRIRRLFAWTVVLGALAVALLIASGLREAIADPVRREVEIALPGLALDSAGYRIALLSDIHIGNRAMQPERLTRIVAAINASQPDLIVIVGDFVNGNAKGMKSDPNQLVVPLSGLRARHGAVASLGNHDHWTNAAAVHDALTKAGVTVLENRASQRGGLVVLGIDDHYSGHADIAATMATLPKDSKLPLLAVNHSPDLAPQLPGEVSLLLAGHTHCGQMVLPVVGSLAIIFGKVIGDAHYFEQRYQCGVVREGRRTTVVTAGLGSGSIPLRVGAPPDWWLVTLNAPRDR